MVHFLVKFMLMQTKRNTLVQQMRRGGVGVCVFVLIEDQKVNRKSKWKWKCRRQSFRLLLLFAKDKMEKVYGWRDEGGVWGSRR